MIRHAFSFSAGIRAIRHIDRFLGVDSVSPPRLMKSSEVDANCILVWGRKESAKKPTAWAALHNLEVWFLEDGFIRSSSDKPHSRTTYSLIVDNEGVYYDATCPNLLENFLNQTDERFLETFDTEIQTYTRSCLSSIRENNVTKYNFCRDFEVPKAWLADSRPVILVVDQTQDDASVKYGCMVKSDFIDMLDSAIAENPDARIVLKTHPDVIAGVKRGYLDDYASRLGVEVLSDPVNSLSVLKRVDRVYVGTSQMGFEALICGKSVSVFGLPFYAGWGVTDDRKLIPRRKQRRSVEQLFFASYDWYSRYANPVSGERWTLQQCIEHVVLQKKQFQRHAKNYIAYGITPWKRKYVSRYLRSPEGSVTFLNGPARPAPLEITDAPPEIVTWGYKDRVLAREESFGSTPVHRIEDGFLRGTGLGSDYSAPQSLVIDSAGLYFNPSKNSDLEDILNKFNCSLENIQRASRLKSLIISAGLSKYNVGSRNHRRIFGDAIGVDQEKPSDANTPHARRLLVVGQVENDASIRFGCSTVASNSELISATRSANPGARIVYKPHPDVVAGNRPGAVPQAVLERHVDGVCTDLSIIECFSQCDEVHTMTSLSGFEALIRNIPVVTYGAPFYAGWGLTRDYQEFGRRIRKRTLEELVYCVLIAYPDYLDIDTGEFITPEDLVKSLSGKSHMKNKKITWPERQLLKVKNIVGGLSYAP